MAGEEFATALLKFVADDSQVQSVADRVEKRAVDTAKKVDNAFREAFRRVQGESGAVAPGGSAGTGLGARTEQQQVQDLEKLIEKLRDTRKAAEKAGEETSTGFAEGFKRGLSGVNKPLADIGEKIGGVARLLTSPAALITATLVAVGSAVIDATKKALEFDAAFRDLAVFVDPAVVSIEKLRGRVANLDPTLGSATERLRSLKEALLDTGNIESAFRIEEVSAKLNKLTGVAEETATKIIGSLADAFRDQGASFEHIADVLFEVQKKGGGNIEELGTGILVASDAAATLNISIDDLGAALIALGERAGANPQKNLQALALLLRTMTLNSDEFRRRGFDIKEIVKTEGFTGLLRTMQEATKGSEDQLKELGVSGRNVNTILKILGDEGIAATAKALDGIKEKTAGNGSIAGALEQRSKFVSTALEKSAKILESAELSFGERILGVARKRFEGTAEDQLVKIKGLIKQADEAMAPLVERKERLGEDFGLANSDKQDLAIQQKRKDELVGVAEALEQVIKSQAQTTEETEKGTESTKKATVASTAWQRAQESLNDSIRELDTARIVRAADDVIKSSERVMALTEASGQSEIALLEAVRTVDTVRAQAEGREVRGLEALLSTRRRVLEDGTAATLKAIDVQGAAQAKGLEAERDKIKAQLEARKARPFAATDPSTQQEINALTNQLEAAEDKVNSAREDALQKRRLAEIKATQDRATDDAKASQERQAAAERALQREERITEKTFQLRQALGQTTANDEISHLVRVADAHKRNVEQRLDAEKTLADKVKALREAAASAGENLLQKAASRLTAQGITEATRGDLENEVKKIQDEAQDTIAGLATGGRVDLTRIGEAFATANEGKVRTQAGRSTNDEINQALESASRGLSGQLQDGTKVVLSFSEALQTATNTINDRNAAVATATGTGGAGQGGVGSGFNPSSIRGGAGDEAFISGGVFIGTGPAMEAAAKAAAAAASARQGAGLAQILSEGGPNMSQRTEDLLRDAVGGGQGGEGLIGPVGVSVASFLDVAGGFSRAFQETNAAADRFLTSFSDKIRSGSSQIADNLFENFMEKVVRRLDDEARRQ